ncbi:putative Receptor protein kinase [Hibiscus syriacus]|uniref:Kinetochore protein SPC25 n=1 Tax=Hibiscus syriacus TaxID=106335 RepID=A0A6A3CBM6_HIBSY|nr:putative Receptor protein kinase [Hibiscus syriacus]
MDSEAEQSTRTKMESLRRICDREFSIQQQKIDSKANLREAEDELVKVSAVKACIDAKKMAMRDSISATKTRVEELKRTVQFQMTRRDEYGAIVSQQSLEEVEHEREENGEILEAISWYNRVLGFQIEGGHGAKFTFDDINLKNPKQEYSFAILHANYAYSLLDCNPHLNGIKELINELNSTNDLLGFVRIMREKFQAAAALGLQLQSTSSHDCSTISMQFKKVSHGSKSPAKVNENQIIDGVFNKHLKEVVKSDILSSVVHHSPRLKELAKPDLLSLVACQSPRLKVLYPNLNFSAYLGLYLAIVAKKKGMEIERLALEPGLAWLVSRPCK